MPDHAPLLQGLTPPQQQAVLHGEGPLLILAAAGSGKTRVITRRIARLIADGVPPWAVLALTFTNKAAGEMRERVHTLILGDAEPSHADPVGPSSRPSGGAPRNIRGLTISTFHALCARLLRRYADVAKIPGLKPDFTIYDTADQNALMKRTLGELDLSTTNWPPRTILTAVSNAKNDLLDAHAYEQRATDFYAKQIARIYTAYDAAMRKAGAIDFDDLLLLTAQMLRTSEQVRRECQDRWRFLMIDEYQDTNKAQFEIARLLAGEGARPQPAASGFRPSWDAHAAPAPTARAGPNICVVGDPDQAIYGWRGADIANILDFEDAFPGCRVIMLGENFRSTQPILSIADTLIKHNQRRKDKPLFTTRPGGERILAVICRDEQHEASLVCDWLRARHEGVQADGAKDPSRALAWREMAVFYRTNSLSRVIEDELRRAGVPYVIARGTAFYQREEVKNALGYLRVVANPADDVSLERIINTPARGLGDKTITRLQGAAAQMGTPVFEAVRRVRTFADLSGRAHNAAEAFVQMIDGWTGAGSFLGESVASSLHELVERVIEESGLRAHYQKQAAASQNEADEERLDNLDELISAAAKFEEEYDPNADPVAFPGADAAAGGAQATTPPLLAMLRAYLETVSLVADADAADPAQGAVTLMTLHAAKGLEFGAVAMIGLEEGVLPHSRAFESEAELEEERRLAFVGITRAMRQLHLSCAKYRSVRGYSERTIPSRFLDEIGREHVVHSDQSDPLGGYVDDLGDDEERGAPAWGQSISGAGFGGSGRGPTAFEAKLAALRAQKAAEASGSAAAGAGAGSAYPPGSRVRHPQFGVGEVLTVSGAGRTARVEVKFKDAGKKTLVLEYARLTRLG